MDFWRALAVSSIAFICAPVLLRAQAPDADLDADLQKIVAQVRAGDMASVVDRMYQPFVEAAGGAASMKAQATEAQARVAAKGFRVVSFEFIKPYQAVSTGVREYRIIPDHSIMQIENKRFEVRSYWLAVRTRGSRTWQYLEGGGLSRMTDTRNRLLPDLKDTPLPAVESKPLN